MTLPTIDTVLRGESVIASIVGTRNDRADVFARPVADRTRVISVDRQLPETNESVSDALSGRVPARVVFQF